MIFTILFSENISIHKKILTTYLEKWFSQTYLQKIVIWIQFYLKIIFTSFLIIINLKKKKIFTNAFTKKVILIQFSFNRDFI